MISGINMNTIRGTDIARYAAPFLAGAFTLAIVFLLWQPYILGIVDANRDHYYRLSYTFLLAAPPLMTLPLTALLPFHLRREVALGALVVFMAIAGFYGWQEYQRVAPYFTAGWSVFKFLPYFNYYVIGGTVLGLVACAMQTKLSVNLGQDVKRGKGAAFGDADWMDMKKAAQLFPETGGIIIGERYRVDLERTANTDFDPRDNRTWGTGGKAPLLGFDGLRGSGHLLTFAGSGGFKSTGHVIPTCLSWQGALICLDPSTEISPMVGNYRREQLKRDVFVLDPEKEIGFNVLDWIGGSADPEQDVATVAQWLLAEGATHATGSDEFFRSQTHNLLTGLLAHVMFSADYQDMRTLKALRTIVAQSAKDLTAQITFIVKNTDSDFVRETLGIFPGMAEDTFSGVHSGAAKDTQWLSLPKYAALVSGTSFKTTAIAAGKTDVFINIRTEVLQSYPGIARVIIGSCINAMMQANGSHKARALFLLDEVNLLGRMKTLETARDVGRKYGITLSMFYQSTGQLKQHFGAEGKAAFFDSAAVITFAAISDQENAREVSAMCGEITQELQSTSSGTGWYNKASRRTQTTTMQKRPLIMPHEVVQELRSDEQIVFMKGQPPLRCGRALYFRRTDMREKVGANRFHR
jgi:type IV secretion system protein VirD4